MYKIKSIFSITVLLLMFVNTKAQFSGTGNGTEANPYLIANAVQLDEMRNYLGSANSDKHFSIINDIDLATLIATQYPNEGWKPIGYGSDENTNAFYGSLEGNGFKITNLWISRSESNYIGLFSNTTDAIINNLNIQLAENGIAGQDYVGILAGSANGGTINNVKVIGIVTASNYVGGLIGESSSLVSNCQSSGEVNTEGDNVGGLIGKTLSEVSGSSSSSNVKNMGSVFVGNFMGGLIGVNQAPVKNSNASGNVTGTSTIGGLVGDSYAAISNSFATGNISGNMWVGGLVGASDSVSNSYATGTVYSDQKVGGGLVGQSYGTITASHASGNVSGSQSIGGLVGILGATVSYSYATGNVTQIVADTTPEGGYVDIGGLAGSSFSSSFIENCFASGDVAVTDNNAMYVGGLVGLSNGIFNSYAYGSVSGGYSLVGGLAGSTWGTISNSAALNPKITSSPTGNLNKIHRIAGDVEFDSEMTNNFALDAMIVNGQIITDGTENDWSGMSKSILEAQKQNTYENGLTWDFTNIWKIRENQ
ncbi:GLUG motif-containing protein [Epilithonimonas sp.]|uniref:GLUG motif-containing protein n=1 Tax=Epilithonimonas sp. TaxID=2894511 RepID=UPI00289CB444|nr:GLUG motif-containing protein [Epilithonimonas sp.]